MVNILPKARPRPPESKNGDLPHRKPAKHLFFPKKVVALLATAGSLCVGFALLSVGDLRVGAHTHSHPCPQKKGQVQML